MAKKTTYTPKTKSDAVAALKKPAAPSAWETIDAATKALSCAGGVVVSAHGAMTFVPGAVIRKGEIR